MKKTFHEDFFRFFVCLFVSQMKVIYVKVATEKGPPIKWSDKRKQKRFFVIVTETDIPISFGKTANIKVV